MSVKFPDGTTFRIFTLPRMCVCVCVFFRGPIYWSYESTESYPPAATKIDIKKHVFDPKIKQPFSL